MPGYWRYSVYPVLPDDAGNYRGIVHYVPVGGSRTPFDTATPFFTGNYEDVSERAMLLAARLTVLEIEYAAAQAALSKAMRP